MKMMPWVWDAIAVAGIALIGGGVYLIDLAAALITVGSLLFVLALAGARGKARGD